MRKKRIGIYGGTFSPPHNGHVHAARLFLEQEDLDILLIIPVCIPPHKSADGVASAEDRLSMCRAAFSVLERTEISDVEIRRKGKSYTVDTLRSLSSHDVQLVMLCGSDMLLTLSDWYQAEQIFQMTEIVYLNRAQDDVRQTERAAELLRREYGASVHRLEGDIVEIASHSVREMRLGGLPWRDALPPPVAEYIERKGLYL